MFFFQLIIQQDASFFRSMEEDSKVEKANIQFKINLIQTLFHAFMQNAAGNLDLSSLNNEPGDGEEEVITLRSVG